MNLQTNASSRKNMLQIIIHSVLIVLVCLSVTAGRIPASDRTSAPAHFSSQRFMKNIRHLASDKLQGRGNGTPELNEAGRFIARQFHKFGLELAPGTSGYLQKFPIITSATIGQENSLIIESVKGKNFLALNAGFRHRLLK